MKIKNKAILMFMLAFAGITICYGQGWTENSLPLSKLPLKIEFTCKNQGPRGDKTVLVSVGYKGKSEIPKVWATDKTDIKNPLVAEPIGAPYLHLEGIKTTSPEKRAGKITLTGPSKGSIICTRKNYPVFVWGNQAWFIYEKAK